jgi:anti-sigma factor (TIGR02949 family)
MALIDSVGCASALARLDDYVDRELRLDDLAVVREHLSTCAACERRFRFEARLLMAIRRALREVDGANTLRARVTELLHSDRDDDAEPHLPS